MLFPIKSGSIRLFKIEHDQAAILDLWEGDVLLHVTGNYYIFTIYLIFSIFLNFIS